MRRKIGRILAPVMAAMLVFGGCGNKTADRVTENQTHKTEDESNEPAEKEPAEDVHKTGKQTLRKMKKRQKSRKRALWILIIHRWMACAWKKAAESLW